MKRVQFEIEVCANSVLSSIEADKAGADRVELCDNLYEGGTTPSAGMIFQAKQECSLSVFPIIRLRGGDFLYSQQEIEVMLKDIEVSKTMGADGFVIGCLKANGQIDYEQSARLVEAAKGLPVTFHRAFDMSKDALQSLEILKQLGIKRLLTSGQKNKAEDGIDLISDLVNASGEQLKIMVGSGVSESNIEKIAKHTKAKAFHVSLRDSHESEMLFRRKDIFMGGLKDIPEYANKYTNSKRVSHIIDILKKI